MANNIYDYSKLLGRLKEKNLTQDQLAAKIGISPASTNLKLCNKSPFKQDEILAICDVLDIDYSEIPAYFFLALIFRNLKRLRNTCVFFRALQHMQSAEIRNIKEANMYKDERGWLYEVKPGLGENQWKVFYWKPRKDGDLSIGWHGSRKFHWWPTRKQAEGELQSIALAQGWQLV